nr:MAG TPA: hypothetical protein [Caudoviricetes sp.]
MNWCNNEILSFNAQIVIFWALFYCNNTNQ